MTDIEQKVKQYLENAYFWLQAAYELTDAGKDIAGTAKIAEARERVFSAQVQLASSIRETEKRTREQGTRRTRRHRSALTQLATAILKAEKEQR